MSPRKPDEPVRLTKIYTRGGDRGETSLGDGSRVSKGDPLVRAYGAVDELNSIVGWAQVEARDPRLERVQNELFDLGADLSVPFQEGESCLALVARMDHLATTAERSQHGALAIPEFRTGPGVGGGTLQPLRKGCACRELR